MKVKTLQFGKGFKVMLGNRRVQAAQMVIASGGSEGGPGNRHRGGYLQQSFAPTKIVRIYAK